MAAGSVISLGIAVNGEETFESALKAINAEVKDLTSGVGATDAAMKNMGQTEDMVAQKNEQLHAKMDMLNQKLGILQQQYDKNTAKLQEMAAALEEAKASGDDTAIDAATNAYNNQAKVVADLSNQMNKCEKDINNTAGAIAENNKAMGLWATAMKLASGDATQMREAIGTLAEKALETASNVGSALVEGIKSFGETCVEAAKKVWDLEREAGQYADTINTLSQQTGIDPIDLQKWEYASQFIDTSVDTITGSMKRLTLNMAEEGNAAGEAFAQLGIKTTDAAGNMRSAEDVFWEAIDALGNVANETERDQLAMAMFGRSAQELNPLIIAGSDAFRQLGDEAQQMGIILDGEALNDLNSFDDAVNKLNSTITGAGRQIAAAFAPALTSITNDVQGVVQAFVGMVNGVEGSKEQLKASITQLCENVKTTLHEMLPAILEFGIQLILTLADAIIDNLDTIIDAALELILALVDGLIDNIDKLVDAALKLIIGLAEGLIKALPRLVEKAPEIISAVCDALLDGISMLWDVGKQWIEGIWEGIKNTADWLWKQVKGFFNDTIKGIMNIFGIASPSKLFRDEVGKQIVLGFAEGITGNLGIVEDAYARMLPDAGLFSQASDGFSVAARAAAEDGGSMLWQDNRPIVLELNDRELGRAVRGYV